MIYTCLCLPSYGWHSFTDPRGMEG